MTEFDVVIIGSGPAGLTAGIYLSRANLKTALVAGSTWGGQLMLTTDVENFPGFEEGIMGPELMMKMRKQAERFGVTFFDSNALAIVPTESKKYTISIEGGESVIAKAVVLAMGANTQWLGLEGESELIGRGISSCAPCDAAFFRNKRVVVVGGGDSAMEEALVLTKFASEVFVVHRRDVFRASKIMQDRVVGHQKIKVVWDTEIVKLEGHPVLSKVTFKTKKMRFDIDGNSYLMGVAGELESSENSDVLWTAPIDGVFVAIGHTPNTNLVKDVVELDGKGFIKSLAEKYEPITTFWDLSGKAVSSWNEIALMYPRLTSRDGIFVAGDVHDHHYKQAVTAAAFGCMAALDCERWIQERYS